MMPFPFSLGADQPILHDNYEFAWDFTVLLIVSIVSLIVNAFLQIGQLGVA